MIEAKIVKPIKNIVVWFGFWPFTACADQHFGARAPKLLNCVSTDEAKATNDQNIFLRVYFKIRQIHVRLH